MLLAQYSDHPSETATEIEWKSHGSAGVNRDDPRQFPTAKRLKTTDAKLILIGAIRPDRPGMMGPTESLQRWLQTRPAAQHRHLCRMEQIPAYGSIGGWQPENSLPSKHFLPLCPRCLGTLCEIVAQRTKGGQATSTSTDVFAGFIARPRRYSKGYPGASLAISTHVHQPTINRSYTYDCAVLFFTKIAAMLTHPYARDRLNKRFTAPWQNRCMVCSLTQHALSVESIYSRLRSLGTRLGLILPWYSGLSHDRIEPNSNGCRRLSAP